MMKLALSLCLALILGGCNSGPKVTKIDTKDVKGTIISDQVTGTKAHSWSINSVKYDCRMVKLSSGYGFTVCPAQEKLEEISEESFGLGDNEILERTDNYVIAKVFEKGYGDMEDVIGYSFLMIVENGDNPIRIKGTGKESFFDPIESLQDVKAIIDVANLFKPA